MQIYRSREVGQSYITSVGTTLVAIAHALWLMIKIRPQVVSDKALILPFTLPPPLKLNYQSADTFSFLYPDLLIYLYLVLCLRFCAMALERVFH